MSEPIKEIEYERNVLLRMYPKDKDDINKHINEVIKLIVKARKIPKHYKANEK